MEDDPTAATLAAALPDDATVTIVGWPDVVAAALHRRGDAEVLVVDAMGDGSALARRLGDRGSRVSVVPDGGVAAAAVVSDLVLVEALAAGPSGLLTTSGSHAAAATASHAGVPVWAVAGVGRVLPARLWAALLARLDEGDDEPWDRDVELVPASLVVSTVGPAGAAPGVGALRDDTCPVAPELLRHTT
jgi:hypothetical protein